VKRAESTEVIYGCQQNFLRTRATAAASIRVDPDYNKYSVSTIRREEHKAHYRLRGTGFNRLKTEAAHPRVRRLSSDNFRSMGISNDLGWAARRRSHPYISSRPHHASGSLEPRRHSDLRNLISCPFWRGVSAW